MSGGGGAGSGLDPWEQGLDLGGSYSGGAGGPGGIEGVITVTGQRPDGITDINDISDFRDNQLDNPFNNGGDGNVGDTGGGGGDGGGDQAVTPERLAAQLAEHGINQAKASYENGDITYQQYVNRAMSAISRGLQVADVSASDAAGALEAGWKEFGVEASIDPGQLVKADGQWTPFYGVLEDANGLLSNKVPSDGGDASSAGAIDIISGILNTVAGANAATGGGGNSSSSESGGEVPNDTQEDSNPTDGSASEGSSGASGGTDGAEVGDAGAAVGDAGYNEDGTYTDSEGVIWENQGPHPQSGAIIWQAQNPTGGLIDKHTQDTGNYNPIEDGGNGVRVLMPEGDAPVSGDNVGSNPDVGNDTGSDTGGVSDSDGSTSDGGISNDGTGEAVNVIYTYDGEVFQGSDGSSVNPADYPDYTISEDVEAGDVLGEDIELGGDGVIGRVVPGVTDVVDVIEGMEDMPSDVNGTDGVDGTDGTGGSDGMDGTDGTDGTDGMDGTDGTDGVDGTDGTDGTDGSDGQDGAAGQDGTDGTDGSDGADGSDGQDGSDGADGGIGVGIGIGMLGNAMGSFRARDLLEPEERHSRMIDIGLLGLTRNMRRRRSY